MTNLPSGNVRTGPMAGTLDGFEASFRRDFAKFNAEQRSVFTMPGQRKAAFERFVKATLDAVKKIRGADRMAAQEADANARVLAATHAAEDAETITQLRADLASAGKQHQALSRDLQRSQDAVAELRKQVAARDRVADALRDELTETRASLSAQAAMARDPLTEAVETNARILAQRVRPDATPEVTADPAVAPDGPRNAADASGLPVRSPGKAGHTPRRTGRSGGSK